METKNNPLLIGITGAFGSGKSTAAEFFKQNGFTVITLSRYLETEAAKRQVVPITRKVLQDIGNEWREARGKAVLAEKALVAIREMNARVVVIDGIRNVGEVDLLRTHRGFVLLAVMVNRKIRFERLRTLPRREQLTWELFTELDRRDLGLNEKDTGLQVGLCLALADVFIDNNGDKAAFLTKLGAFLTEQR